MHKLTIQYVFSNFQFYQQNYQHIMTSADDYYQPVESALLDFSVISQEQIYLGDLLQLWFNQNWQSFELFVENKQLNLNGISYIFAIKKRLHQSIAYVWSPLNQQVLSIEISNDLALYLPFIQLVRPKRINQIQQSIRWAKVS